jgi:hypothetical protein
MPSLNKYLIIICIVFSPTSLFGMVPSLGYISSLTVPWYSGPGWDDFMESRNADEPSITDIQNNPIIGFSIGIIGEYPFNRYISFRGEMLLSASGGGYARVYQDGNIETNLISEINLDFPISVKINIFPLGRNMLYLTGGFQISTLLNQNEFAQNGPVFDKRELERGQFAPLGFGGIGGIGLDVPRKDHIIFLEIRFLRELTTSFIRDEPVYQNIISMSCGIRWKL